MIRAKPYHIGPFIWGTLAKLHVNNTKIVMFNQISSTD